MTDDLFIHIQYKGTSACLDLTCPDCEAYSHFCVNMPFSGAVRCDSCKSVFILSSAIQMRRPVSPGDDWRVEHAAVDTNE